MANAARTQLLTAGERLIAANGIAVSLRDIAIAAGQRNNSAVHYHFGSRAALLEAIVQRRQTPLEKRRIELIDKQGGVASCNIGDLIAILVTPLFTIPYQDGSNHYARFLHHMRFEHDISFQYMDERGWLATKILCTELISKLGYLSEDRRNRRLRAMMTMTFSLLADLERERETAPDLSPAAREERERETLAMIGAAVSV